MSFFVIKDQDVCSIDPQAINTSNHFFGAFGNKDSEVSAHYIVLLCQEKGNWDSFTKNEIEDLYNQKGYVNFRFNDLISGGWIVSHENRYYITIQFVARAYGSSPKIPAI